MHVLHFVLNFVATSIFRNQVILAGRNATFNCSSSDATPKWHFYSLSPGSEPCGFASNDLHPGISLCPSTLRISMTYSSTYRDRSTLTIVRAQLSDAGTYTCGSRNPYNLSMTASAILGVIGTCTLLSTGGQCWQPV